MVTRRYIKALWAIIVLLVILTVNCKGIHADELKKQYVLTIDKISFKNEESGAPEPYGNIKFCYYYKGQEQQKTIWEEKNHSNPPSVSNVTGITYAFLADDTNRFSFLGNVKESDAWPNPDDVLAYPNPQEAKMSGTVRLYGESSGSYVDITYHIKQQTDFTLNVLEQKGLETVISWTKLPENAEVDRYQIYKNEKLIAEVEPSVNWYQDAEVTAGEKNNYKVKVTYDDGSSEISNQVTVIIPTNAKKPIRVMSQNMYFLATPSDVNQQLRAKNTISPASYFKDEDIIIYEEVFEDKAFSYLMQGISKNWGFNYHTKVLGNNEQNTVPDYQTGGVAIASKWPILKQEEYYFKNKGCGIENVQRKGISYAQIDVSGTKVNVFGTHTQSDISLLGCNGPTVRKAQIKEIKNFIDSKKIPADEPIVLGGDFNIDRYDTQNYNYLLNTLGFPEPHYIGAPYTWDIEKNRYAMSSSSPGEHSAYLDYLFIKNDGTENTVNSANPVKVKSEECNNNCQTMIYQDPRNVDFSDHYPVQAVIRRNE